MDQNVLERVMSLSTGEKLDYDVSKTWMDLFIDQVNINPEKTAVIAENGSLSYEELDLLSDRLAAALIEKEGVEPDEYVAVRMGRVKEFHVAALAIHKAGAAYMPIDLEYPADRVDYMMEDSGARLTLTEESVEALLKEEYKAKDLKDRQGQDRRAYMIYTSGSTGKPKGVVIPHRALTNFVHFITKRWGLSERSRIVLHSNFAFDAAVEDLFPALTVGGTVFVVPESARKDVFEMRDFITKNKINGGSYSTQFGQLLAMDEPLDVDYLCMGGEAMTIVPKAKGPVYNVYGPTEFTVDATYFELEKGREYDNIPIGRPLYNCSAYIVDDKLELLPPGETGELCLAGPQLAQGYWKRPDLTQKAFTTLTLPNGEEVRIYRTGDLAFWNDEGQLEFCGRIDTQVKLRGFRIELGEVESRAARFPGIRQTAAEVRKNTLCLYYTSDEDIDEASLCAFMGESLADYMVPGVFIKLDDMPLNVNGKIDRKKLPDPKMRGTVEYAAPETEVEKDVVSAMARVLGADETELGVTQDFFELGGDSIKAIRLVSLLREKGYFPSVADVMRSRNARLLASGLDSFEGEAIDQDPYEGYVEDTSIFAFFKDLDYLNPAYYNQSTLLRVNGSASIDALQKASDAITYQHDMLRAVIKEGHLYVRPASETITVEEYTLDKDETESIKKLCEDIQSGLDIEKSLVRLALLHAGERDLFFLTAHHTIVDGVSWRIWMDDLETAYGQALKGEDIQLPAKTHTYRDYADAMKAYRCGYLLSLEIPYWKNVEERMLKLDTSDNKDYTRQYDTLSVSMSKEDTDNFLHTKLNVLRLEVNDLLLTALGQGYREVFNKDAISVSMEGHGREELGRKLSIDRTIGWFTSVYPVVLEGFSQDAKDDLIRVKETLHAIPNKGVGYNILAFVEGTPKTDFQTVKAPMVIFNYLGDVSGEGEMGEYFEPDSADGFSAGLDYYDQRNHDGSDLVINCLVDGGCFTLWLDYNSGRFSKDKAESFAEAILKKINMLGAFLNAQSEELKKTASDLGETEWSIEEFEEITSEFAERNETIQRIYPLTPMQEGMLLEHVSHPESRAYRLIDIYECKRPLDEEKLRQAVDAMAERHEVLRTAIIHKGVSRFRQAIVDRKLPLRIVDLTGSPDPFLEAQKIRQDILDNGYDLQDKPLTQFVYAKTSGGGYLIFATHHIITDGWCFDTMLRDLNTLLDEGDRLTGSSDGQYERVVREQLTHDRNAAVSYFGKLLEGYDNNAVIPSWGEIPIEKQDADDRIIAVLPADITQRLSAVCKEAGATLADGFNLAWGLVLSTLNRTEDVVFTTITSGRDGYSLDVSELVGLFINPVPVRVRINKDDTARSMLANMNRQAAETKPYDLCSLSDIRNALGEDIQLTGLIISFENYSQEELKENFLKPVFIREEHEAGSVDVDASVLSDGTISVILSYDPAMYSGSDMERIMAMFENYAARLSDTPDVPLNTLPHLSDTGLQEVIELSKGETFDIDTNKTWLDLFKAQAERTPDSIAVSDENGSYTYSELDRASDCMASYLIDKGVSENSFVAIRMGREKEFLAAAIGVHKAGAAYVPIDPEYPKDRIDYMLDDSEAKLLLGKEDVLRAVEKYPDPKSVNRAAPDTKAYMIYTSGSTGLPKGVMISHSALLNLVSFIASRWGLNESSRVALHSTFSFDAAVEDLYPVLTVGGMIFVVPERARKDIFEMRRCIEENHLNSGCYSTQFGQLLGMDEPLDINYICVGGEAMTTIPKCRGSVYNTYGPTEFTVDATFYELDKNRTYRNIPIGRPLYNCAAFILDAQGRLLPKGCTGELCLAGPQLAQGYWKRPELTEEKFTYLSLPDGENVRIYKTGDLVRWNDEGQLEFYGRIDFQVKLRGFRIELGEIESVCMDCPGVSAAAAEVKKSGTTQILCLYYTVKEGAGFSEEDLKGLCKKRLTDYMVPSVFMKLDEMPLSPSGKVNRKALPMPEAAENIDIVAPETETERKLHEIAAAILGTDQFGVTDDLVSLGLTSIAAMRFAAMISQACETRVSVAQILKNPLIRALAEDLDSNSPNIKESLKPYPKQELYPITENQRGIIIDWELKRTTTQYNIPEVIRFDNVGGEKLTEAVRKAVNAHAYLKTIFTYDDGEIKQKRRDDDEVKVSIEELDKAPDQAFFQSRIAPFDLFADRLYRFEIYTHKDTSWLFWDIHHTVYDGLSRDVLVEDMYRALSGEDIESETLTAYDFAIYEKGLRESNDYAEAAKYFTGLLSDAQVAVFTGSRTPDNKPDGEFKLYIPQDEIDAFCKKCGVTPGSFFQAVFCECLRRITREEKPLYVTVSNGRSASTELMDCVGMFVKTIPVAAEKMDEVTCEDYVIKIHRQMQESYARDFYPYTEFVEKHGLRAEMMLVYQGGLAEEKGIELRLDEAKFPVSVEIAPDHDEYLMTVEYDGMKYSADDIEVLACMLKNIAHAFVSEKRVCDVASVAGEERENILKRSAGETLEYDDTQTWIDMVLAHVSADPDRIAVVDAKGSYTYKELDEASNRIAAWLIKNGVEQNSFVAIKMDRVKEFFASVIGVQKAGVAYVPIDPAYPEDRIAYMLEDSQSPVTLDEETVGAILLEEGRVLPVNRAMPETYAYMIYTSGSTGKPKGVMISQRSLRAYVAWATRDFGYKEGGHYAHCVTFSFDASVTDIVCPLSVGAKVHVISAQMRLNPAALARYLDEQKIEGVKFPTQLGMLMLNNYPDMYPKFTVLGGEKLLPVAKTHVLQYNEYGPTEFTIGSNVHLVDQEKDIDIPIGKAVPNSFSLICDPCGQLLPWGMVGELCLAGTQIASGYWKRPELTAERFVDCPALPGMKMYHTGDLARYNRDGELEYLGRIDNQVKLRGFRIEMGEIENRASLFEGIEQVAAAVKKDQLVLYYSTRDGKKADTDKLKGFLSEALTDYMVPAVYIHLTDMPITPAGKIDRKALPEPELKERIIVEPESELQKTLCEMFAKALSLEKVGINENFFTLGGTSLKAASVMMSAMVGNLPITYQDIFNNPTVQGLEELILKKRADEGDTQKTTGPKIEALSERGVLEHNRNEYVDEIKSGPLGNVLLTGATGFLGAHVLYDLIKSTDEKVYCLVRSGRIGYISKLKNVLVYYFEMELIDELDKRIFVIEGDIEDINSLEGTKNLDYHTVINCAACVKHFADVEFLKKINLYGVENLTRLCLEKGARLIQISTISVSGDAIGGIKEGQVLTEDKLEIGQEVESNAYVYTKYLAEKHVLKSIEEDGLDAKIIRVGNLSSRVKDGEFQMNFSTNASMNTLRAYSVLGGFPIKEMSREMEFSYIDETARAVVLLSGTDRAFTVFHAYNGHTVEMGDVIYAMNACGIPVKGISGEDYTGRLKAGLKREDVNSYLAMLVGYDLDDDEIREEIPADNHFTINALYKLGFRYTITDLPVIEKMIESMKSLDFFDIAMKQE